MSKNLSDVFYRVEKDSDSLQSLLEKPIVIIMNHGYENEYFEESIYAGILEHVDNSSIYLKNPCWFDYANWVESCPDLFAKLDPAREDPAIKLPKTLEFEMIDSIYCANTKLTLEHTCDVWSDPRDYIKTQCMSTVQHRRWSI